MKIVLKVIVILSLSIALSGGRLGNRGSGSVKSVAYAEPVPYPVPYMDDATYEKARQKVYAKLSAKAKARGIMARCE